MIGAALLWGTARGVLATTLLAFATVRWSARLFPGAPDAADRSLRVLLTGAFLPIASVVALGLVDALTSTSLVVAAVLLAGSAAIPPRPQASELPYRAFRPTRPLSWLLALAVGVVLLDGLLALPVPPTAWDAMTYHLHIPNRWLQEGGVHHVPTVFGDPAAAYAPQNGAALFAWILGVFGRDAGTNAVQVAGMVGVGLAVGRLAWIGGVARTPTQAVLAGSLAGLLAPLRHRATTANVDVLMLAAWTAATTWAAECHLRPAPRRSHERARLLAGALAAGLASGTKTVGLPLALMPLALLVFPAPGARSIAKSVRRGSIVGAAFLVGGGWWFVRNLALYSNPVFPVEIGWGPLRFPGVFRSEAMDASVFQVDAGGWRDAILHHFGPIAIGIFGLGIVGWLLRVRETRGRCRTVGLVLAGFPLVWIAFAYYGLPYRNQVRFLLPAFLLACAGLPGLARILPGGRSATAAGALAVLVSLAPTGAGTGVLRHWRLWREIDSVHLQLFVLLASATVLGGVAAATRRRGSASRATAALTATVTGWAAIVTATAVSEVLRPPALLAADFHPYASVFLPFQSRSLAPSTIAYTGLNVPYPLSGPDLRHRVVYADTRGNQGDGLFEHWRRDPRTFASHRPGIYRGSSDRPETWLDHLAELGADLVVVFELIPVPGEVPDDWPLDDDGFPVERRWMEERPDLFQRIGQGGRAEVYRVTTRSAPDREASADDDGHAAGPRRTPPR